MTEFSILGELSLQEQHCIKHVILILWKWNNLVQYEIASY